MLKCRFIYTGRPKKIWAMRIDGATIDVDDKDNQWYQIGTDMLLTSYDELGKYRNSVQSAQEFGVSHFVATDELQWSNVTNVEKTTGLSSPENISDAHNSNTDEDEYCCAG